MRSIITIGVSLLTMAMTTGVVRAEPLDVKPGLWETTTTIEKKRAQQPTNLDRLTPEQRAKVEAKLAHQVKRETGNAHRGACDHTFETQTSQDLIAAVECRGANKMVGTVKMHADDPEHMSGIVEMTYGPADRMQLYSRSVIESRWIRSDCGVASGSEVSGHAMQ